ncbi:hypothetical protein ACQP1G_45655 [Nocardia sp. CA-107356]|uniref:hypothetical protein n=1 Tax=Nocardia sp. CA-107356 TaxID=3239972 RepID=UPI003D8CF595
MTRVDGVRRGQGPPGRRLWAASGRDRMPYPLHHRTEIADFDELKRHRKTAVTTLLDKYSPEPERAIEVLPEPDARMESEGLGGIDLSKTYRFHRAIRGAAEATRARLPGPVPDRRIFGCLEKFLDNDRLTISRYDNLSITISSGL